MEKWKTLAENIENSLRLDTKIIGFRRFEKVAELEKIPDVQRFDRLFTFCQLPTLARVQGWTVGATKQDVRERRLLDRCSRIHGLRFASEKSKSAEAVSLATTWFGSEEDARKQQEDYARIPPGEAIVLSPLAKEVFEPEVVLIYGNPAQIMLVMCALQKERYEQFHFSFIGEGACSDSLAKCYVSGKPAAAIPCYGERSLGGATDNEMVIALSATDLEKALTGIEKLERIGLGYPVRRRTAEMDLTQALYERYSDATKESSKTK
jgi:uncharacterized protein (DUF169 family)